MNQFIRLGSLGINTKDIISYDLNHIEHEMVDGERVSVSSVRLVRRDLVPTDVGADHPASGNAEHIFKHGTPEAHALLVWLTNNSLDLLHPHRFYITMNLYGGYIHHLAEAAQAYNAQLVAVDYQDVRDIPRDQRGYHEARADFLFRVPADSLDKAHETVEAIEQLAAIREQATHALTDWEHSCQKDKDTMNTPATQNKDLAIAFTSVANASRALDQLLEEKSFLSSAWKQAFSNVFERLASLKSAPPRDAATLGLVYCKQIHNLINDLVELPANQFSIADLCTLTSSGRLDLIDKAESAFEDVLQDLYEGTIYEDGTLVGMVSHKVRFNNEEDLQAAIKSLVEDWEFANVGQETNALSILFESDHLLDERTQSMILKPLSCVNYQFNVRPFEY